MARMATLESVLFELMVHGGSEVVTSAGEQYMIRVVGSTIKITPMTDTGYCLDEQENLLWKNGILRLVQIFSDS